MRLKFDASDEAVASLEAAVGASRIQRNVLLGPFSTFRIGGPADLFVQAGTPTELADLLTAARAHDIPHFVLGMGANILIGDRGFRGLVIRNAARSVTVDRANSRLFAESGAIVFPDVIEAAVQAGLSGLEHYVGIPSTIGGALWQNLHFLAPAPARQRTMYIEEVLLDADILTAEGERRTVDPSYFQFGYDFSVLHVRDDVVLSASFQLEPADEQVMRRIMAENLEWRAQRHPPLDSEPSAGSIFKKIEGIGAGRLIDESGLKGTVIGGAQITHRHANIMINRGAATAADVMALIEHVQSVVEKRTGYALEVEISMIGEFASSSDESPHILQDERAT